MSREDAYREARKKLDKTALQEQKLKTLRNKQDRLIEFQKKIISEALNSAGVNDVESCLRWCFGPDYGVIPMTQWCDRWNHLHGNVFKVWGTDDIQDTFQRLGRAYMRLVVTPFVNRIKV